MFGHARRGWAAHLPFVPFVPELHLVPDLHLIPNLVDLFLLLRGQILLHVRDGLIENLLHLGPVLSL